MSFFAESFIFDGVPSETFNVHITNLGDGGDAYTTGSNSVDIVTQSIFNRAVPYFYGASQVSGLSFPCAITSPDEIVADESRFISNWLFGQMTYKKLQIVQDDMLGSYFNCFLNNPQTLRIGNKIHGYQFEVVCDAPWAWAFEKTLTKTYTDAWVSDEMAFINTSDNNDYVYPELVITHGSLSGDITIMNATDDHREFILTGLTSGEVITMDNDRGIISSSEGLLRMDNFNKNWFRLLPGYNSLHFYGRITSVDITYAPARKVV